MQNPPDPHPLSQAAPVPVVQPPVPVRPYHKPQLTALGDIKQLTQAVGPNGTDGGTMPGMLGTS